MALIRGVSSLFPCPRCLILMDKQGDRSVTAPLQTTAAMKTVLRDARGEKYLKDRKAKLKAVGLRDVDVRLRFYYPRFVPLPTTRKNVFWKIKNSDPFEALSFDRLHTLPGGMFRHHLWGDLKKCIEELGREAAAKIDDMYVCLLIFHYYIPLTTRESADSVPRWRGLNHFKTYLSVEFTDGTKWEDMSKVRYS